MTIQLTVLRRHIQNFAFVELFNELGWDHFSGKQNLSVDGTLFTLKGIAEKRGFVIFHCPQIPHYATRRKLEKELAKLHQENMLVYSDAAQSQQIYQWVLRTVGKPAANRQRFFQRGQTGEAIAQLLQGLAFSLAEEESVDLVKVAAKVKKQLDVEKITKRFYERFKKEHDTFLKFIKGIPDENFQRWYVSVMLNRIMFIYFVQKKGFLDHDTDYLVNRLNATEGNYYREFLLPLFFQGFALRANDRPEPINQLLGKIPYLNGGLFARHSIEEQFGDAIAIDNRAFQQLFDFFKDYSWHLDERPLKKDSEINPDVLGYIFEKYINQKQMGAYYTKEDITGYITRNTVIPYLFDAAQRQDRIAFAGEHSVWKLAQTTPDRYIYPAVQHGVELPLPVEIACGVDDVAQRGKWNTATPPEVGLPTEIWRETIARRQRYAEVRGKLAAGEITTINDFITYNLDIEQFAQDVIENTDSPDLLRAFWKAINELTVLDPTVGSGAFLFAALNILESLYETCLERMESFIADSDRIGGSAQKFSDFRKVLTEVENHANRRYFILKRIMVNNLYGVDIMEEAVEICKLRLFLKLVAQIDSVDRLEPLPDIDFNICAGNTLVGFARYEDVESAVRGDKLLLLPEEEDLLAEIRTQAEAVDRLFALFRQQQTQLGGEVLAEDKLNLRRRLGKLQDRLNRLLAIQYGVNPDKLEYEPWLQSHEPLHWFVEFYGVLQNGGFDVIVGNPPYVEYSKIKTDYSIIGYSSENCGNLYAFVIERVVGILNTKSHFGMIVPMSLVSTDRTRTLRELLVKRLSMTHISNFSGDAHPSTLFNGVKLRLSIILGERKLNQLTSNYDQQMISTKFIRWFSVARPQLFQTLVSYQKIPPFTILNSLIPKIGHNVESTILAKLFYQQKQLGNYIRPDSKNVVYAHRIVAHFVKAFDSIPYFWNEEDGEKRSEDYKIFGFSNKAEVAAVSAILNSNTFYYFYLLYSDAYHCGRDLILSFPCNLSEISAQVLTQLSSLSRELMEDLRNNSARRKIQYRTGWIEYDEFYPRLSKEFIDKIDHILAQHYGFTDEELDYIINYDIKYRMGDDLQDDEE